MNRKEYLRALNEEIQKLNGIIDYKILHNDDYRREARRHKRLLAQLRKEQSSRLIAGMMRRFVPSFF